MKHKKTLSAFGYGCLVLVKYLIATLPFDVQAIAERLQQKVDEEVHAKTEALRSLHAVTHANSTAELQIQQLQHELTTTTAEVKSLRAAIADMNSALSASHETSAFLESDVRGSSERAKLMSDRTR